MKAADVMPRILAALKVPQSALRAAYRVGSRVYGTAGPASDEDYVVILSRPGQRQDLAFAPGLNVVIHGVETFQKALDDQSLFALECFFAKPEHVLLAPAPPWSFKLDKKKLARSATEKSNSDWEKGIKRFVDEPEPSRKKLFHALRVPIFALQIMKQGKIVDYTAANELRASIMGGPLDDATFYEQTFGPVRGELLAELGKLS